MTGPVSDLKAFDTLPIETSQHIGSYLGNELDLCRFRLICRSTRDAIDADRSSFWRRRFLATFEKPTWSRSSNEKYKKVYQERKRILMFGANFKVAIGMGQGGDVGKQIAKGTEVLEILRDLIVDSFSGKKEGAKSEDYVSLNMLHIRSFIQNQDLLQYVFLPELSAHRNVHCLPTSLLHTVQVMLAPVLLSHDYAHLRNSHFAFPSSQTVVYGTNVDQPIFGGCNGLDIKMDWVLHHINFWKYHMVREQEHTLFSAFRALEADERPRFWDAHLQTGGRKLGKHWKGSYAYVERDAIVDIRKGRNSSGLLQDEFNGEAETASFQNMTLKSVDDDQVLWPPLFEEHLKALAPPVSRAKTRAQHRSATPDGLAAFKPQNFQFCGAGHDVTEDFLARGWLNALPPQQGIPGWQRVSFMKYFEDPDTGAIDYGGLWAYEGVVLPGGQIMLGRWWSPNDGLGQDMYSGPFILWCVDGAAGADWDAEEDEDGEA